MASYPAQRKSFTPYTSIPGILDTATAIDLPLGRIIEFFFYISGGSGTLYLLKWVKEGNAGAGRWYRYRNEQQIDFATKPDWHVTWFIDKDTQGYYQLLLPPGVTATEAFVQGI